MITKITRTDDLKIATMTEYLNKDTSFNIFILGDIENFGISTEFQDVWAEFDNGENCMGVLLRFFNYYIFYSQGSFDAASFAKIISEDKNALSLAGKKDLIDKIETYLPEAIKFESYYAQLSTIKTSCDLNFSDIKIAEYQDVDNIAALRNEIPEFGCTPFLSAPMKKVIENGAGRCYYINENNEPVSMSATRIETKDLALIGSICTKENYRNKGYASKLTLKLCQDLLAEGKEACLFYSSPQAGSIYKKIGFEDIGMWTMLIFK